MEIKIVQSDSETEEKKEPVVISLPDSDQTEVTDEDEEPAPPSLRPFQVEAVRKKLKGIL